MAKSFLRSSVERLVRSHREHAEMDRLIMGYLRDLEEGADLARVIALLPEDLATRLRESYDRQPPLKSVEYWKPREGGSPPSDVTHLVQPRWRRRDRKRIVAYLRASGVYTRWRGLSYCRFQCGVPDTEMGSRCLTDGEWVWPEGLPHYVESHAVRLPEEVVATMSRNRWAVPERAKQVTKDEYGPPRSAFWIAWKEAALALSEDETGKNAKTREPSQR